MKSNQGMVEATASGSPPRRGNAEDPVVLLVRGLAASIGGGLAGRHLPTAGGQSMEDKRWGER
jgi:hypothetical protein